MKNREGSKKGRDVSKIQKVSQENAKFTACFQTALKTDFCEGGSKGRRDDGERLQTREGRVMAKCCTPVLNGLGLAVQMGHYS